MLYWYRTRLYALYQLFPFAWRRPLWQFTAIFAVGAAQHCRDRDFCDAAVFSRAPDKAHCSEEMTVVSHPESPISDAPCASEQGLCVQTGATQIDLHRLELRFESTRIIDASAVQRLANSIRECGQLVPCIAAGTPEGGALVLIDGYRRLSALRCVGADTALVQCWYCPLGQALAQLLAHSGSRAFDPIEEALLLRELIDSHGLSQRDAARQCARDVSWVQRRLVLLNALPHELVQAVRNAQVSSWAASRILAPLARANSEHATRLLHSLKSSPLSTRELQAWFNRYQGAQHQQRERMVEHPRLLIDTLRELSCERTAKDLRGGPEREMVGELSHLQTMLRRLHRRLAQLDAPPESAVKQACQQVHASLPCVTNELSRLMA
jgi:ParB/RepB/Spo0J family partition protein